MNFTVLHYHFRPGGVRRVIECGLPVLVKALGSTRVTLLSGEPPPDDWRDQMEREIHPCTAEWISHPVLGYWSPGQTILPSDAAAAMRELLLRSTGSTPLWAHNLSVGRNLLLAREVAALPGSVPRWLHHHDWWWDGRWERWPEFLEQGFSSLAQAVEATLPAGENIRHLCVNATDARRLSGWLPGDIRFIPNIQLFPALSPERIGEAKAFLHQAAGISHCWLYPCRALRRKNIAEALLVQRCLAPDAVTLTTGGPSSAAEEPAFQQLVEAARTRGWPLRTAIAAGRESPDIYALMAAAGAIIITSLKEGFGLPYGEAALAGRPCLARIPRGLGETLAHSGAPLARQWTELPVPRDWFDAGAEAERLLRGRERLAAMVPPELRTAFTSPQTGEIPVAVDFGSLTLIAQLEVLTDLKPGTPLAGLSSLEEAPLRTQPWSAEDLSPERWVNRLLAPGPAGRPGTESTNWRNRCGEFISPLVRQWLEAPLLWPSSETAAVN